MHCSGSDSLVSATCPAQLWCLHPMAFLAGMPAQSRVFSCIPLLPQLPPVWLPLHPGCLVRHRWVPAKANGWLSSPFLPKQACCEGVPSFGIAYLFISGNCKGGKAPASPPGAAGGARLCPELRLAAQLLGWGGAGSLVCCFGVF